MSGTAPSRIGVVSEFDDATGLGTIESDGERFLVHCVEIADGTRTIAIGQSVEFELLARLGRYQAGHVVKR